MRRQVKRIKQLLMELDYWVGVRGHTAFCSTVLYLLYALQKHSVRENILINWYRKFLCNINSWKKEPAVAAKPKDTDYNVRQSKIAIGSGGFAGRGF